MSKIELIVLRIKGLENVGTKTHIIKIVETMPFLPLNIRQSLLGTLEPKELLGF